MPPPQPDQRRKREIVRAWARGVTPETVADMYEVPLACVEELLDAELESHVRPSAIDPERAFAEQKIRLDALVEELAAVSSRESGAAQVRAIETRFKVLAHRYELLQQGGIAPRPGDLVSLFDGQRAATKLCDLFEEQGVLDDEMERKILAIFGPPEEDDEWEGVPPLDSSGSRTS